MANLDLTYEDAKGMSERNKLELVKTLSKRANTRLKNLEKNDYNVKTWSYGKAQRFISSQGRENNRFYEGIKYESAKDLNRQLQEVMTFLGSVTSTVTGVEDMLERRFNTFSTNQNFNVKFDMPEPKQEDYKTKKDYKKARKEFLMEYNKQYENFYDFVKSKQLELLKKTGGDSGTYMDDFVRALQQGYTVTEIQEQYGEYLNSELTFEQVQERYNRAEWQLAKNGGNLFNHGKSKRRNNKRRKK